MVILREYTESDVEGLVQLANNENVSRYLVYTFPYPYTRADAEWWIRSGSNHERRVTRAIELDGVLAGTVGIERQSGWREHVGEIGYWIGEPFWGRGVATAALLQMTDYGFTGLGLRKLFAPVLGPNAASMRVATKAGYVVEAVLPEEVRKGDRFYDVHQFARHRSPPTASGQ